MGIDFTSLFKSGLYPETNKDFLIKTLNGFYSEAKIEKSLNESMWLKNKQWSLSVNFLLLFTCLSVKADRLKCSSDLILW